MRPASVILKTLIAAAVVGASAWGGASVAHRSVYASETANAFIRNGAWFTTRYAGSADADARTRAVVAATGLLALPREETVYFRAHQDDEGQPISSQHDYIVVGKPLPARWWSLTLYDGDNFLNRDATGPNSVKSPTIVLEPDGSFKIILSRNPHDENWIDMGTGENMSLSLRVYNPEPSLVENLETAAMFSVKRAD